MRRPTYFSLFEYWKTGIEMIEEKQKPRLEEGFLNRKRDTI